MKNIKLYSLVSVLLFFTIQNNAQVNKQYKKDTESVQNILDAYYNTISGPIGEKRDFNRLGNLFHPKANFIYTYWNKEGTKASALIFDNLDKYAKKLDYLDKKGFYEHEISNIINQSGTVIQVLSIYTFRVEDKSIEPKKGVTSYNIFYDGERYWIMSMFWNIESNNYQIPKKYLKKNK